MFKHFLIFIKFRNKLILKLLLNAMSLKNKDFMTGNTKPKIVVIGGGFAGLQFIQNIKHDVFDRSRHR